ncbi:hypothetical protein ACEPAI_8250 [Sanghuangporus weigelae]
MSNPDWRWPQQHVPFDQNPSYPTANAQQPFVNFLATQSGSMNGALVPTTNQNSGQQFPRHVQYNYGTMASQGEQGSSNWQQQFQHYNPQNLSLTNGLPRRSVACEACRKARRRVGTSHLLVVIPADIWRGRLISVYGLRFLDTTQHS